MRGVGFATVRSEGGLLPPDLLVRIAGDEGLPGLDAQDYHLAKNERLREAISRSWSRLTGVWESFRSAMDELPDSDTGTTLTRERWLLILLQELGFGRLQTAKAISLNGREYPVSHIWGSLPIHLVSFRYDLDRRTRGAVGAARAPHSMVQELLNRSDEHLWAIVSNGLTLRVVRDNLALTRQAYLEFDLEGMMNGQQYADFSLLWLLCHQSRFEGDANACWLESWMNQAHQEGARALDHLRNGVERSLITFGRGFLADPANGDLRRDLQEGRLSPADYYRELLRLVYRLLFLFVTEDRGLLLTPDTDAQTAHRFERHYSTQRLRRLAGSIPGSRHDDLWRSLTMIMSLLGEDDGCHELGLPALGGTLWDEGSLAALTRSRLRNADLLEAIRHLAFEIGSKVRRPIDYKNLGSEELGSVYEALLELHPDVDVAGRTFSLGTSAGSERRSTGSYYTPPDILATVLDFALQPRIAECLAQPDPESALLDLRVLDPTCGSGHFLTAAGRRIASAVAAVRSGEDQPTPADERRAYREVVARCLYGIDSNRMAVELAQVALWLDSVDPGTPLSFLDHHIRHGDSLLGTPFDVTVRRRQHEADREEEDLRTEIERLEGEAIPVVRAGRTPDAELDRAIRKARRRLKTRGYHSWPSSIPDAAFDPIDDDNRAYAKELLRRNRSERASRQGQLGLQPSEFAAPQRIVELFAGLSASVEATVAEVRSRAADFDRINQTTDYASRISAANTWVASWFWPKVRGATELPTNGQFVHLMEDDDHLSAEQRTFVSELAIKRSFFHPQLAFPEVFARERQGFDLVIGNPPYLGGMKISGKLGSRTLHFLKSEHPAKTGGRADLAVYFVRRFFEAIAPEGDLAFVTTNTIAQGDTRDASLKPIVLEWGGIIQNAIRQRPWSGDAAVNVSIIHLGRTRSSLAPTLDGREVEVIGPDLSAGVSAALGRFPLNERMVSVGTNVLGKGFWIDEGTRDRMIDEDPRNSEVIKPFVGARHAMRSPNPGAPERWVIDFGDRTLPEAEKYTAPMEIVRSMVKPQRDEAGEKRVRENWWIHGRPSWNLYSTISQRNLRSVIAIPETSKLMLPVVLPSNIVFQHSLLVFMSDDPALFGVLTSSFHWLWAANRCTTMRGDPRYNPSLIFAPFPLPDLSDAIRAAGAGLHQVRSSLMADNGLGLTRVYNLVTDPDCHDPAIDELRHLHVSLDATVASAYGWDDLIPGFDHGQHQTERFGVRWVPAPGVQGEIERRLVALNLEKAQPGAGGS